MDKKENPSAMAKARAKDEAVKTELMRGAGRTVPKSALIGAFAALALCVVIIVVVVLVMGGGAA